ncbi:MAG: toprim domain-containing protein [Azoarcus sp.]|jgi:hypothetical protein|nr:toprim domain-containing protein [Azoarcus sp.]
MIADRLLPVLLRDFQFKEVGDFLRAGKCPHCGKRELYTLKAHPWILRCARLNKCGAEIHVKEIYPELFNDWSKLFPATDKNPHAAADAYLRDGRGFDLDKLRAWGVVYRQESYFDREKKEGSAVVRFSIGGDATWERIIDRPERFGARKASFRGAYGGMWWCAGTPAESKEIWIVEGIFDALALMHHGLYAVAAMSCSNYPDKALAGLAAQCDSGKRPRPLLVWALDNDKAGRGSMVKHLARARKDGWKNAAALVPSRQGRKLDWNDVHQLGRLEGKDIQEYRYQGDLFLAPSPQMKAAMIYAHSRLTSFHFDFDHRIFWWKLDLEKMSNDRQEELHLSITQKDYAEISKAAQVTEICNCLPQPLYYVKNDPTDEAWYYFRIDFPHDAAPVKNTFSAGQLAAASEFKKRLLHIGPGAIWAGNSGQLDVLLKKWTFNIKTVETVDYIGYSASHKVYVFNTVAVSRGRIYERNDEDYFEIGALSIKSLSRLDKMDINTDLNEMDAEWFDKFYLCFGVKGLFALAFWFGSLFAEQIRERFESFPFMEIVGEPGSGKTTLLEMLWKLLGRSAYEGFDPMKSSHVGFLRAMAQVSNLPVVLIESDRDSDADNSRGRSPAPFHWDSLKSLYNGGSLRTTGVKSAGNDTHDPQFRAALVISQNAPVAASAAIMERIIHLSFDKSHQSDAGREAALALGRMPARAVSGFLLQATRKESEVMAMFDAQHRGWEQALAQAGVKNQRIQKNYGQLFVLLAALEMLVPISGSQRHEAVAALTVMAVERERDLARDHIVVERFWEAYDYLNGMPAEAITDGERYEPRLNHSRDPGLIAINLNHFTEVARQHGQQAPEPQELKKHLRTSKQRKFVDANVVVSSAINARFNGLREGHQSPRPASIRCWVFRELQR